QMIPAGSERQRRFSSELVIQTRAGRCAEPSTQVADEIRGFLVRKVDIAVGRDGELPVVGQMAGEGAGMDTLRELRERTDRSLSVHLGYPFIQPARRELSREPPGRNVQELVAQGVALKSGRRSKICCRLDVDPVA